MTQITPNTSAEHLNAQVERLIADYTRVSKDQTGVGGGVASQHEVNEQTAERRLGRSIDRTYSDNSISAHNGSHRPGFERLLVDMESGVIGAVIVWRVNRLFRPEPEEIGQVGAFIALCRKHKVRVIAKSGEYDLESADGRNAFLKDAVEAGADSDQRGENVALARKRQARSGRYGGGVRPYGWGLRTTVPQYQDRNDGKKELLRPVGTDEEGRPVWLDMSQHNPEEAEEIRGWKRNFLSGVPMAHVLTDMRRRHVLTVSQKDGRVLRRNGKVVESGGWDSRTVVQILTHPRTAGHAVYRGEIVQWNAYPPIIEEDERQALITLFADPSRKTSPGNTPKWLGSLIYRCGVCNDGTTVTVKYNCTGKPVYRCKTRGHCQRLLADVDAFVEKVVIARLARKDVIDLMPKANDVDVAALRNELRTLEARKQNAAQRFALGKMDDAQMDTITEIVDERMREIRAELKAAAAESPFAEFVASEDAAKTWQGLSLGRKREILRLMPPITLLPVGRGRKAFTPSSVQLAAAA